MERLDTVSNSKRPIEDLLSDLEATLAECVDRPHALPEDLEDAYRLVTQLADKQEACLADDETLPENRAALPNISGCPDCGHTRLSGIERSINDVTVKLAENSSEVRTDEWLASGYSFLECSNSDIVLIEDCEIIHDDLQD